MRYNMSIICRTANILARSVIRSQAFKMAWALAKARLVEKVAGVQYGQRQAALRHLTRYSAEIVRLHLIRERDNLYDVNAVAVAAEVTGKGQYKMGYLSRSVAAVVAPVMDRGINLRANLKSIVGGYSEGISYGLRVRVAI